MEKLKLHSPDLTAKNIDKIAALFPNCVTEATSEAGSVTKAIDFDLLRQELTRSVWMLLCSPILSRPFCWPV